MINKDYILRLAERFGRSLAIILHLRKANRHEEALLNIDEIFLQMLGLTSGFINSASEEMLLTMISPLGMLNIEKCLWLAVLLKEEGDIFGELDKPDESYYRYIKALFFFLEAMLHSYEVKDFDIATPIEDILQHLEEYELPAKLTGTLIRYFEQIGEYAKAEDMLFESIDAGEPDRQQLLTAGKEFYQRLLQKSDADLQAGGLSKAEAVEGLAQLQAKDC